MNHIYTHTEFRSCLQGLILAHKERHPASTQSRLAQQSGINNTYLTNALKGRANLSADQAFRLGMALKLAEKEIEYLMALREKEQSAVPERQRQLEALLAERRRLNLKTEKHLKAAVVKESPEALAEYYTDPYMLVVHVMLGLEKYAGNYKRIAPALAISLAQLEDCTNRLARLGFVKRGKGEAVAVLKRNFHLPQDSPLCLPHQLLLRSKSMDQIQRLHPEARYNFSVTFSAEAATRARIQEEFLAFLKKAEALVKGAKRAEAFQMNFDLFPWNVD